LKTYTIDKAIIDQLGSDFSNYKQLFAAELKNLNNLGQEPKILTQEDNLVPNKEEIYRWQAILKKRNWKKKQFSMEIVGPCSDRLIITGKAIGKCCFEKEIIQNFLKRRKLFKV
jgi:hypothetical protein